MNLHILSLTIHISKRKVTRDDAFHQQMIEKLYEHHKDRQILMYHY
ncbi:YrzI family small protein [Neobacillus sp. Marseille-QA0830]